MKNFLTASFCLSQISLFGLLGGVVATSITAARAAEPGIPVSAPAQEAVARRVPLGLGELAPDFTLSSGEGESITLSSFREKKNVVLYFYPKDGTPGCTKEAQDFSDDFERFKKAGAVVLGVSVDDVTSHKFFAKKLSLNFPILADVGGKVSRQYGVMGWIMAKRVTYVIGKDGMIHMVYPDVDVTGHSKAVLKAVQDLSHKRS